MFLEFHGSNSDANIIPFQLLLLLLLLYNYCFKKEATVPH